MLRIRSVETEFWSDLFVDLTARVEWLGQAIAAMTTEDAPAAAVVRIQSYAKALHELHEGLRRVHEHRPDPRLKPLFALDGPLAGFLSRLYAWTDEIGDDFERMALAVQKGEPVNVVFSHRAVNDSFAHFTALIAAMRRVTDKARADIDPKVWRAFDEHLEELIWATEWVHMTLARPPGD